MWRENIIWRTNMSRNLNSLLEFSPNWNQQLVQTPNSSSNAFSTYGLSTVAVSATSPATIELSTSRLYNRIIDILGNWYANRQLDLFVNKWSNRPYCTSQNRHSTCAARVSRSWNTRKPRLLLDSDALYLKLLQFPPNISSAETAEIFTSGNSRYSENKATIRPAKATTEAPFQLLLDVNSQDTVTSNFMELLQKSWNISLMNISRECKETLLYENIIAEYSRICSKIIEESKALWQLIESHLLQTRKEYTLQALSSARLTPVTVPFVLLQRLLTGHVGIDIKQLQLLIGAYVVQLTLEMLATRIVRLARSGPSMEAHLAENWRMRATRTGVPHSIRNGCCSNSKGICSFDRCRLTSPRGWRIHSTEKSWRTRLCSSKWERAKR